MGMISFRKETSGSSADASKLMGRRTPRYRWILKGYLIFLNNHPGTAEFQEQSSRILARFGE
jgi:hypothetical protein